MKEEKKEHTAADEAVQKNLSEQFKEMENKETPPPGLKKEVFNTLDALTLLGDFADLFTAKFTEAEGVIVEALNNSCADKKEDKEDKT